VIRAPRARRLILPAAAVAAILLGAGLAFALAGRPPASLNPAATATAPASHADTAGPGQGQPQVPRVSLASVRWSGFYGVELPVSAQAGPFGTSGGVAAGFAHTPLGALLAAVNIGVRANAQWGPRIFTAVIRGQVTGPDAAALLAGCQAVYDQAAQSDGVTGGQPLGTVDVTEQAFRWITLTESRSAASPLIAALTDTVMRAGRRQAERNGGRLDPPMAVILDEAANICRIADLPELYSHLGSRGMVPVTVLQFYQQGVSVWGEPGMAAMWGASTKKVIGAGIDDPRHARDLATLVGQHDVPVLSVSYGDGRASQQVSLRRQEILDAADIRALAPGSALLLATGARPALISLRPWYTGPQASQITAAIGRAEAAMQRAAQRDYTHAWPAAMPFQHREEFPS